MTRPFRLEEDERRYLVLRSEFFVQLVQSGVRPQVVHDIMRNFGKLEDMMLFEGVRQGMAAALLMPALQPNAAHGHHPLTVHHNCYGSAATPLVRAERERIDELGAEHPLDHPWLSKDPVKFGPLTITEATKLYGPDLVMVPTQAAIPTPRTPPSAPESEGVELDADIALSRLAAGESHEDIFGPLPVSDDPLRDLEEVDSNEAEPLHRPALLDRIRDILGRLDAPPKTWQEMVLMLMRETKTDAAHLDAIMSTPMGMTVISQVNLFHLHPGAAPEIKAVSSPPR